MSETAAQPNHAEAMQIATDLRADGRGRHDVIDQLRSYRLEEMICNRIIDEVDLIAGMLGREHPVDITPEVRQRVDAESFLLPVKNYRPQPTRSNSPNHRDAESSAEIMDKRSASSADQMLRDGKNEAEVVHYLQNFGCPEDQAVAVAHAAAEALRVERIEANHSEKSVVQKRLIIAALLLFAVAAGLYFLLLS